MAKKTSKRNPAAETETGTARPQGFKAPEGFTDQSGDLAGFYDPERQEPILFVPLEARAFDGSVEPNKPSVLITAKLVESAVVKSGSGDDAEDVVAPKGALIGIWGKPGMKALRNLRGAVCWMVQDGELDTGKPNPMKIFKIASKGEGSPLVITEDFREESLNARTMLDARGRKTAPAQPGAGGITQHETPDQEVDF